MNLLLTILVAAAGSYLFYKFRIPAGALIGAIIFSAALNIITGVGTFPGFMKTVLQAVAGAVLGQRVTRNDLAELRRTLAAGILMFFTMVL